MFIVFLVITLGFANVAAGAEITDLPWNDTNIKTLRTMDKEVYFRFYIRQTDPENEGEWTADSLGLQYDWYSAGNGTYELAINLQTGPDIAVLYVYWQVEPGKITYQGFGIVPDFGEEWYNGPQFADLNHDGGEELILFSQIEYDWPRQRTKFIPDACWPQVYRLRNGKYVEASRDFPGFYTKQILPQLDEAIIKACEDVKNVPAEKAKPHPGIGPDDDWWNRPARYLAALIMARDQILRVLGRDPTAGLAQAREWMKSPDPVLVDDAESVFMDIGGHQQDVQAAKLARDRAAEHWPFKPW